MQEVNVDNVFLAELQKGSPRAFEELYLKYFRMVEDMIFKFNGTSEDAKDIFQEALFVFVKKLREPDFVLTSKASTYLYAIARNLYFKKTGRPTVEISMDEQHFNFVAQAEPSEDSLSPHAKDAMLTVMTEQMALLEEDCRSVILYSFYQGLSHAQIAGLTGYTEAFVKVKKFRCLEYLRKLIKGTDVFKNL